MNTDELLAFWANFMRAEGLAFRTVAERITLFRTIETEIGKPLLEIKRVDLIGYFGRPEIIERWSASTRRHYRSSVHTFYTWLQDEDLRTDNPAARLPRIFVPDRDPNPVPVADIQLMVSTGAYRRTRVMIALHYYAGLRVHEIARMHGSLIDWRNRVLRLPGKGGSVRSLGISAALWEVVKDMPQDRYWFPNHRANHLFAAGEGHIMRTSVSDAIHDAMIRSGIVGHRPHDLRASTATEQDRAGVSPLHTRKAMRHQSLATTTKYTAIGIEDTRDAFDAQPVIQIPARSGRRRAA